MNERLKAAIEAAKALLAEAEKLNGDEAKAKREAAQVKRAEAQEIADQIKEAKMLSDLEGSYMPLRPELPGSASNSAMAPTLATQPTQPTEATKSGGDVELLDATRQAAYVTRFNDVHDTVKGILKDLHGNDYQATYWAQKGAFNRYIRGGEQAFRPGDGKLLKGIVMTPAAVRVYLDQGVDDLAIIRAMMVEASDTLGGLTRSGVRVTNLYAA